MLCSLVLQGSNGITMDFKQTNGTECKRTGPQDRSNPDRYFHVMNQGWYIFTREGIVGPYISKERAQELMQEQIASLVPEDKKESWRYNRT